MLVLWKLRFDGTERTNPRGRCKSGECLQRRHHESLPNAAAARDAIASRIEILKQAIYAKEPFHVQLVKVQGSTYACGGGSGEEAQRGLDCQRGGGQGGPACAEPPATDGRAHGEDPHGHGHWHERRTVELWRMARCLWSGWQWDQPDGDVQARAVGERTALGMEVENLRGAVLGLQQGQVDVQAGMAALIGELRGMAAAVAGLQQAAVPATPVARSQCQQSPEPMSNQLEPVTPRGTSKMAAEQSPEHPIAKCQQIEDSKDELIAGGEDVAQQQQMPQLQQQGWHGRFRVFQSSG